MPFSSKPFDFVGPMAGNLYIYPDWLFNHAPQADAAARLSGQSLRHIPTRWKAPHKLHSTPPHFWWL